MTSGITDAPRPLRVLQLTDNLRTGGVQKVVVNLSKLLPSEISVGVAAAADGVLWNALHPKVTRHHAPTRNGMLGKFKYVLWLRRTIRAGNYDIIHAHQRGVSLAARLAAIATNVPVVEHVHNTFNNMRLLSFRGDQLIACGSAVSDVLVDSYKRSPEKIHTVLNFIPDFAPKNSITKSFAPSKIPVIIGLGRMTDAKDPLRFVRVVTELNSGPDLLVNAIWVGDGELRDAAEALALKSGTRGISFAGNQKDVASFLQQADILLMTSKREGLPLALLESMCLGRGVIAPAVGSCKDAVETGRNGILYDPEISDRGLASVIRDALDPGNLSKWASNSREIYLDRFHPHVGIPRILDVYETSIRSKSRPRWNKTQSILRGFAERRPM